MISTYDTGPGTVLVCRSQGVVVRRHESSRVLFVTLSKSETYKETIVRVLVPQSLVLIAKLIIVLVPRGT